MPFSNLYIVTDKVTSHSVKLILRLDQDTSVSELFFVYNKMVQKRPKIIFKKMANELSIDTVSAILEWITANEAKFIALIESVQALSQTMKVKED